ncbi:DUF4406 domain-containing protein [Salmonella enterica]|nr:DUF4406 domain-containing protein [Salmonella enterica]EEM7113029.1 DUF4406 domain-containing protein [Salmonella enterica subsp. enterica serovar Poona]HBI5523911.1 DUF4406 domain-containing protein [Salmonella enterica subsp. enterica serovar Welikade]EAS9889822.1 DUF4406 domain-containing protein [Salmonella enterica]EEG2844256.1 DUF4406 domain-containing protein [Salmonella enterica]
MKVYIAGPMSGLPNFNRDRFNEVAGLVVESGNIPLNPATLPDGLPERDYMAIGIAMLQCADAIYLIEGWENSAGAGAEKALADKLNIPRIRLRCRRQQQKLNRSPCAAFLLPFLHGEKSCWINTQHGLPMCGRQYAVCWLSGPYMNTGR